MSLAGQLAAVFSPFVIARLLVFSTAFTVNILYDMVGNQVYSLSRHNPGSVVSCYPCRRVSHRASG